MSHSKEILDGTPDVIVIMMGRSDMSGPHIAPCRNSEIVSDGSHVGIDSLAPESSFLDSESVP
jgi:hypothetical protein